MPTRIAKPDRWRVEPNIVDYDEVRRSFSWTRAQAELDGLPGGGLNIAFEAVERHVLHGHADRVALCHVARSGAVRELSYGALLQQSNRFTNVLRRLGVGRGERVFTLLGRVPELYVAALGTWKQGAVFVPLFSAFGPEPVRQRMQLGDARLLVTSRALYERKVASIRQQVETLEHVLLIDGPDGEGDWLRETKSLPELMGYASNEAETTATDPEDMAIIHFTSGTTGTPKGAVHVHRAVVSHYITAKYALDLHPGEVFWCTADPGWVTGTSYGIIAPLTHGVTSVIDEREFDAERWYALLEQQRVSVWYTAPTAIRMLMRAGVELPRRYALDALRFVASVGEPLNPEAVVWGIEALGMPIHDNWWQTETGGIMIANTAAHEIRPGSMGRPLPGVDAAILARDEHGELVVDGERPVLVERSGQEGELALRVGWPAMFRGYLHMEQRYRSCFLGDWYRTGDLARRDDDGFFWFVGRADDVIKSAGHLIGPFEVESALLEHPAVAEAAAIGVPDPVAGEIVKAFVTLAPGYPARRRLQREIVERPWAEAGQVSARPVLDATLSADHRASDGHRGALFLAEIGRLLQHPEQLVHPAERQTKEARG